ncbi:MAG: efflux RND transporter permease subunit [Saprospiraceae bacterium]
MSGSRQDVVCKIFGENMDTLARYAGILGSICNSVEGSSGLFVESVTGMPQIVIRYRRDAIAQYGIDIADINRVINTSFAGQSTGLVYEGDRRFDLVVRLDSSKRNNLNNVSQLLIPASSGIQLPPYMLADVQIQEGVNQIQRENSQRRIIVGFNVRGRDIQTMVTELQSKVEKSLHLPPGYFVTYGGAFENLEAAKSRLSLAVPISLLLIFILLYFAFQSVKLGVLIYSAIPLSAIGGILALASRGIPFSISSGVGFIALFGVAVLNGIVLIAEFKRLRAEGYHDLRRIVIQGTKIRLRPVLMTAFVASLGFLPMALSHGEGAEVQRPLATVVIGGLLVATFLTLFVLPILYIMFNQKLINNNFRPTVLLTLLLLFLIFDKPILAQRMISPQDAIAIAMANNVNIKNAKLKNEYQQKLLNSTGTLSPTAIHAQLGQYNSKFRDQQFSINQSFSFPTVYRSQKNVQKALLAASRIEEQIDEARLQREVLEAYWEWIHLNTRKTTATNRRALRDGHGSIPGAIQQRRKQYARTCNGHSPTHPDRNAKIPA